MQSRSIRDLPASKLPLFHTDVANGRSPDTASAIAHSFTIHGASISPGPKPGDLLGRFARFVGDIVGSDHVAFLADAPDIGPALVEAVIAVPAGSGVTTEPELTLYAPEHHAEELDLRILIGAHDGLAATNGAVVTQKGPFVLSVQQTQEDRADVTLTLRGDYGGSFAAKHLAELAVAYLTHELSDPIVARAGTGVEPSRVNFKSFLHGTSQSQHRKSAANGSNKSNGVNAHTNGYSNGHTNGHTNGGTNGHVAWGLLHKAFEDNVRRHPDNVAVDYLFRNRTPATSTGGSRLPHHRRDLTYAELDARAENLADELGLMLQTLESRWRPVLGDQYAFPLFIAPSPEFFLAELAVLKSGHAFCSLPADAPTERLRAIVENLGSPVVLGVGAVPWHNAKGTQTELDQLANEVMWIDITNPANWRADRITPVTIPGASSVGRRVPTEEDLCYLFYTSGSTGLPKGVLGSHRAAVACVESTLAGPLSHLPAGPRLRWLNLSAPSFDPVIIDAFVPLSLGGVLCCAERDLLLTDVEACARELGATASYAVASLGLLMRPEHMPTLKTLVVGGEAVNGRVVEKFAPAEGDTEDSRRLVNAYGPTETTIFCTAELCTQNSRSSVIGDALMPSSSGFFLMADGEALDAGELRETPLGLTGELVVGGPQVAHGYLNRPEATAKTFIPADRFPELGMPSGTMLYRTGDKTRVVWSADGRRKIDFIGRISSDQIKLSGRRVELSEIENVLAGAEGVAAAAVVAIKPKQGAGGRTELAAFLTAWSDEDRQHVVQNCRATSEKSLPEFMCPTSYAILDHLPYTASGKVDRAALLRVATGEAPSGPPATNGSSAAKSAAAENDKHVESLAMDSSSIVNRGLVTALGDHAAGADPTTPLLSLGLDSLRIMLLLQSVRSDGVDGISMHEVLALGMVGDLINLIESKKPASARDAVEAMDVDAPESNGQFVVSAINGNGNSHSDEGNDVDVAAIPADDEDALYELSVSAKLRHFSHHCLTRCTSALNLSPADIEQVLPATNTQTRMLYIITRPDVTEPGHSASLPHVEHFVYNLPLDKLDPGRFRQAVETVLGRHDCFRAIFCSVEHPLAPFALCILNKDSPRAALPTVEVVCKFDPQNTSLWEFTLVSAQRAAETSMTPDRPGVTVTWVRSPDNAHHVMILSVSHPSYDGVTLSHLREEIAAEYAEPGTKPGIRSLAGGKDGAKLPLLPLRSAVELLLGGTDWTETMMYWMTRFAGVPPFRLLPGLSRPVPTQAASCYPAGPHETHMRCSFLRSSLSMNDISTGAASHLGTTMAAVVQAAWASVLAQTRKGVPGFDGRVDVQFGSILHGRHTQDLWRCMAPLLTTLPIHLAVEAAGGKVKNPTNRQVCRLLTAQHADAAPYIEVPCPNRAMFELGHVRFDTALTLQVYKSETTASDDVVPHDLPGWSRGHNLLPPYKEIDTGFPVLMEVWPAFGPEGPDWSGKASLKCTVNVRKPGYEFLGDGWSEAMLGALEEALVKVLGEPDGEFYVG
jgi:acyl-CoA synthetase (AMP-forming)/AMP-acid ligase II/aryl carrier-like protein